MYAKSLSIQGFKCFGRAELDLQYPGRTGDGASEIPNVNLLLGDNGGGKSSVLRALAIAVLAPALLESGFVPYRMVRRPRPEQAPVDHALLKVVAVPGAAERAPGSPRRRGALELVARIERRGRGSLDRLRLEDTPASPVAEALADDGSPAFFVVGYGATRRVVAGDFPESGARRARGPRYRRVAGLFEDDVALRSLQAWLPRLRERRPERHDAVVAQLARVLPPNLRFAGARDEEDDEYLFDVEGAPTPFSALSGGHRAFIGWVGDLLGHLAEVAPPGTALDAVPGIVLVDEVDLHLHPEWQRGVVPSLAGAFPRLQFVFTSHSPLVASTVRRRNVFVTGTAEDGTATARQIEERVHGRSAEQLLLSSYFGLRTTRSASFQEEARGLFERAARGEAEAALAYLDRLTAPAAALAAPPAAAGPRSAARRAGGRSPRR